MVCSGSAQASWNVALALADRVLQQPNRRMVGMNSTRLRAVRGRTAVTLLAGAFATILLQACGQSAAKPAIPGAQGAATTASDGTPVHGGTLTIARSYDPQSLNPLTCACDNGSLQVMVEVFDTLVSYATPDAGATPVPDLARSWSISPDGRTYTFHLRAAAFSNGQPVTAQDVRYSLMRASDPASSYGGLYPISSIQTPDSSTVVLRLKTPAPGLIYALGFPAASIVPEVLVRREGDAAFSQHPVGSGPFVVSRWLHGQELDLAPNPRYWQSGLPYLSAVRMLYVPNDNTRILNIRTGAVDIADEIPFSQVKSLEADGTRVLVQPSSAIDTVILNNSLAPLGNLAVRQALAYATPVQAIAKTAFAGLAPVMNTVMPKLKYWNSAVKTYPYDIARAKQLLARSPFPHGFALTLSIVGSDTPSQQTAQIVQASWAQIGVNVKIQQYDYGTIQSRWAAGQYQSTLLIPDADTSDLPVDDEYAHGLFDNYAADKNLYSYYRNPVAQRLAVAGLTANDESARRAAFEKLQEVTMAAAPSIPLVWAPFRAAVAGNVHGFGYVLVGWYPLQRVWLSH
jgi:peptide/nickel transport system substrate-binding protein